MYSFSNLSPAGRQTQTLTIGEEILGRKVRFTIEHDTSYASQSYAKAEVWDPTGLRWNLAETYHYAEWAGDRKRQDREGPTDGIIAAYEELQSRVSALLS